MVVEVAWSGIRRLLQKIPDGVLVAVVEDGVKGPPSEGFVTAVDQARVVANAALAGPDGDEETEAPAPPTATPAGVVVDLSVVSTDTETRAWLDAFSRHLEASGRSGVVRALPQGWPSGRLQEAMRSGPTVTAFLTYSTSVPPGPLSPSTSVSWFIDPAVTELIAENVVGWGRPDSLAGHHVFETHGTVSFRVAEPVPAPMFASLLQRDPQASVLYITHDGQRFAESEVGELGRVTHCMHDEALSWEDRVEHAATLMVKHARYLNLGFLRALPCAGYAWFSLMTPPRPPLISEANVRYNQRLLNRLSPDAYGIQILTREHLSRAHDLSHWKVEKLDGDRYLVQARNLADWFADPTPSEEIVQAARVDFGEMLMSRDRILAEPDGYIAGTSPEPKPYP